MQPQKQKGNGTPTQMQYEASVAVYDEIEIQALGMADVMSKGIIKQFHIF